MENTVIKESTSPEADNTLKEYTYTDVSEHNSKEDLYMVINEKVYDVTKFLDEHPGGEEVMLDAAGQDATEAFEDVGHSDEAREILDRMTVGSLKRLESDPKPMKSHISTESSSASSSSGIGIGLYILVVLGGVAAFGTYKYLQSQDGQA
ncbi:hypothetical protein K3495_g10624 [Podosphaera aphanis]|nr:hypothetical protein K3495_g10624 [Podosphaera aphanis]